MVYLKELQDFFLSLSLLKFNYRDTLIRCCFETFLFVHLSPHVFRLTPAPGGLCSSETGSESVHTDLNDEHKGIRTAARDNREGFKCDNNVVIATGCNMAPYEDFTPIYIIKNLVVKPVRCTVLHCPGPPFCNVVSIFVLCRLYISLFFHLKFFEV